MEVHHHHHTNTHKSKKEWHTYFWEFLMMFFAITASFFAENQREHFAERSREKQFMISMVADLKRDSIELDDRIEKNERLLLVGGTLFTLLRNYRDTDAIELYRLFDQFTGWSYRARLSDRTISQLKAGGMRLIHYQVVSDSIQLYEEKKLLLSNQGEGYVRESYIISDLSRKLLDYSYLLPNDFDKIPKVIPYKAADFFEFSNEVKILRDQIDTYVQYMKTLRGIGFGLIRLIQGKYHLK